ncbi:predicted protein [Thalassiosira pseudonana CCMP1335]|uniref:Uncharacterized protein n=1 Tax=Thalassiosira pseudonana TaxID=35128 RepID=B8CBV9_THAPS|nr:predicted protein [Thalassiosira pseudonana CCMP1335]EED89194.1 predicted protein [Thalassiosira pseudonana CCMP1335]|eukprot:scaffold1936_cov201-Alexandrium_tamarense.AAC.12
MEAFISLSPTSENVRVYPANWSKQSKSKGKGHTVRCIRRRRSESGAADGEVVSALEVGNVDSIEKVYRIITEHMKMGEINQKACECLKCYFQGNERLDEDQPTQAITLYNQALTTARDHNNKQTTPKLPLGTILMKRATAYLRRAANHRKLLRILVRDLTDTVPSASTIKILYQTSSTHPALAPSIFQRLIQDSKLQQTKFRQIRYRHDMYEFALLHAAQDSLQATQLLPTNGKAWLLAGQCLAELRKLKESNQYYERALELDPSLEKEMKGVLERNRKSQEFIEVAKASGFSGDTLRLALDVAA